MDLVLTCRTTTSPHTFSSVVSHLGSRLGVHGCGCSSSLWCGMGRCRRLAVSKDISEEVSCTAVFEASGHVLFPLSLGGTGWAEAAVPASVSSFLSPVTLCCVNWRSLSSFLPSLQSGGFLPGFLCSTFAGVTLQWSSVSPQGTGERWRALGGGAHG